MFDDLRTLLLAVLLLWVAIWAPNLGAARLNGNDAAIRLPVGAALPAELPALPLPEFLNSVSSPPPLPRAAESGPARVIAIPDLTLDVRAAFAMTENGRELFVQNADEPLPIASLTKLLTALAALDHLSINAPVPITLTAIRTQGDSAGLVTGETLSLHDALLALLLESSNDAAMAIAEAAGGIPAFVAAMEAKADAIGVRNAHFANPHGLAPPSNIASARDVAALLRETLRDPVLFEMLRQREAAIVSMDGRRHAFRNTNALLPYVPGIIGGKTGFTEESRGTLAIAFSPRAAKEGRSAANGDPVVVAVVLGSADRFSDTEALARWVLTAYEW